MNLSFLSDPCTFPPPRKGMIRLYPAIPTAAWIGSLSSCGRSQAAEKGLMSKKGCEREFWGTWAKIVSLGLPQAHDWREKSMPVKTCHKKKKPGLGVPARSSGVFLRHTQGRVTEVR